MNLKFATLFISLLFLFFTNTTSAQMTADQRVLIATDTSVLMQKSRTAKAKFEKNRQKALRMAADKNWSLSGQLTDGSFYELMGVDANDQPIYYTTTNANSAISISTDEVLPGGASGLNLAGAGMTVGEWDGGAVLLTHEQFAGRVTQMDAPGGVSDHATHVCGTIVGDGTGNASAMGMAPQANLNAYDWSADEAEMAAAAAGGLLISNHSYGRVSGWRAGVWNGDPAISVLEDYKFGFYNDAAAEWDEIAFNAPFYLICKSAGNDRDDVGDGSFPQDGNQGTGFDCIPTKGNAKNILTVGATLDVVDEECKSVAMTIFSGWGPTDDGRIKPDICANGSGLLSASRTADDAYTMKGGTSMSSPSVAGSATLLQQHYNNLNGSFMRAATLKGLIIHTADEAGPAEGPDYMFGWGLMNTRKAADLITEDVDNGGTNLREMTLFNGGQNMVTIHSDGRGPLTATIAWTDVPGTPEAPALDPGTLKLVNDLDMRIVHVNSGTVFLPYRMNPAVPDAPATRGDNFRDNVEKIYIADPLPGDYEIYVSHKAILATLAQRYSLITSTAKGTRIMVTNANNLGDGSLREAIELANCRPGPDTIAFNIPLAADMKIDITSALPAFEDDCTVVDATTQPGYTLGDIILSGLGAGFGFVIRNTAPNTEIYGFTFENLDLGISIRGDNFVIGDEDRPNVFGNGVRNGIEVNFANDGAIGHNYFGTNDRGRYFQ